MSLQQYQEIEWPAEPSLVDPQAWQKGKNTVLLLCSAGTMTEWTNRERTRMHMPWRYDITGVEVEFLPHWGKYKVGGIALDPPTNLEQIARAVGAVKTLLELGLTVPKR